MNELIVPSACIMFSKREAGKSDCPGTRSPGLVVLLVDAGPFVASGKFSGSESESSWSTSSSASTSES